MYFVFYCTTYILCNDLYCTNIPLCWVRDRRLYEGLTQVCMRECINSSVSPDIIFRLHYSVFLSGNLCSFMFLCVSLTCIILPWIDSYRLSCASCCLSQGVHNLADNLVLILFRLDRISVPGRLWGTQNMFMQPMFVYILPCQTLRISSSAPISLCQYQSKVIHIFLYIF